MDAQREATSENARGSANARTNPLSDDTPPKTVRVAVLPSSNAMLVGSPIFGSGQADAYNLQRHRSTPSTSASVSPSDFHRDQPQDQKKKKSVFGKLAKTLDLNHPPTPANNIPPFVMKNVPYDEWRRHYAKDADGNYRGTHAPAQDCLLKPHDVEKWQCKMDEEEEIGDKGKENSWTKQYTRGNQALPVYAEVVEDGMVPGYEADYEVVDEEA